MAAYERVLVEIDGGIGTLTLNRPEKLNAFVPPDMFRELTRKIEMAVDDPEVKVIILRGAGRSFCTGDDLNVAPYDSYGGQPGVRPSQRVRVQAVLTWINDLYKALTGREARR